MLVVGENLHKKILRIIKEMHKKFHVIWKGLNIFRNKLIKLFVVEQFINFQGIYQWVKWCLFQHDNYLVNICNWANIFILQINEIIYLSLFLIWNWLWFSSSGNLA